jgi:hypothetical protein
VGILLTEATANPLTEAAASPLDQLRDIHLPEPIGWWPLAPGWWILMIGGCLLLSWLINVFYRRYSAKLYRRQALKKLHQLESLEDSQQQLRALFELLKQTANSAYPSRHPGSQSIMEFIRFMQLSCDKPVFEPLNLDMNKALYGSSSLGKDEIDPLFVDAKIWIVKHQPEDKIEDRALC